MSFYLKSMGFNFILNKSKLLFSVIYVLGIIHWCLFIYFGDQTFLSQDWPWIYQWYDILKHAVRSIKIPYHVSMFEFEILTGEHIFGNRYFAMSPISHASPQFLFLSIMNVQFFMTFQIILLYSIGVMGIFKWIKKLKLSTYEGSFLLIMYSFNGAIISKMGVGFIQMGALYLIPWFLWMLMKLIASNHNKLIISLIVSLEIALFLFFVLLQGSFHVFYQMVLVGFCITIFYRKLFFFYCGSIIISLILCSYYIIPNFVFSNYTKTARTINWHGYESPTHILTNLILPFTANKDASWEYSIYISFIGVILIIFSLFLQIRKHINRTDYNENEAKYNRKLFIFNVFWMLLFLPFLLMHKSKYPEVMGLYSVKYFVLLISYVSIIILIILFIVYLSKILKHCENIIPSKQSNLIKLLLFFPWLKKRYLFGCVIILLFSIGPFMGIVFSAIQTLFPIPAIDRVPSRLFIYPLFFLFLISSVGLDRIFSKITNKFKTITKWGILFLMTILLLAHSAGWSVSNTESVWINADTGLTVLESDPRYVFRTGIFEQDNDYYYKKLVRSSFAITFSFSVVMISIYMRMKNKYNYKSFSNYFSSNSIF